MARRPLPLERYIDQARTADPFARLRDNTAAESDVDLVAAALEGEAATGLATHLVESINEADVWDIPSMTFALVPTSAIRSELTSDLLAHAPGDPDEALAAANELSDTLASGLFSTEDGIGLTFAQVPLAAAYATHPLAAFLGHRAPDSVVGLMFTDETWMHIPHDTFEFAGQTISKKDCSTDHRGAVEGRVVVIVLRSGHVTQAQLVRNVDGIETGSSSDGNPMGGRIVDTFRRTFDLPTIWPAPNPHLTAINTYVSICKPELEHGTPIDALVGLRPDLAAALHVAIRNELLAAAERIGVDLDGLEEFDDRTYQRLVDAGARPADDILADFYSDHLVAAGFDTISEYGWDWARLLYEMFARPRNIKRLQADPSYTDEEPDVGLLIDHDVYDDDMVAWFGNPFLVREAFPNQRSNDELLTEIRKLIRAVGPPMLALREMWERAVDLGEDDGQGNPPPAGVEPPPPPMLR